MSCCRIRHSDRWYYWMFERANGDIVPGAVEADGEGGLRVYEITGGSHRSDFSYRLLGEAEYKEIWKKPSRRRF